MAKSMRGCESVMGNVRRETGSGKLICTSMTVPGPYAPSVVFEVTLARDAGLPSTSKDHSHGIDGD